MKKKFNALTGMNNVVVFVVLTLFVLTGCTNLNKDNLEVVQKEFEFIADESLSQFIDKHSVYSTILEEPFGATGPVLAYSNEKTAVILNFNGILVYDLKTGDLLQGIDNQGLGANQVQGSTVTEIKGNEDYLFITNNDNSNKGYVYSIHEEKLAFIGDASNLDVEKSNFKNEDANLAARYVEEYGKPETVIAFADKLVAFYYDYNDFSSSKIVIFNETGEKISDFSLKD